MDMNGGFGQLVFWSTAWLMLAGAGGRELVGWLGVAVVSWMMEGRRWFWPVFVILNLFHPWSVLAVEREMVITGWVMWVMTGVLGYAYVISQKWSRWGWRQWLVIAGVAYYVWLMRTGGDISWLGKWLGQLVISVGLSRAWSKYVINQQVAGVLMWGVMGIAVLEGVLVWVKGVGQ